MIVTDAGVLAVALGDDGPDGDRVRLRLRGESLAAPALVDVEVLSVWRRHVALGLMSLRRADIAMVDLAQVPLQRAPHEPLVLRCWELRENVTVYDACYVALAELLAVPLVTADRKLAGAPGLRCVVDVLS